MARRTLVLDYPAMGQHYEPRVLHLYADCSRFTYSGYPTAPARTRTATRPEQARLRVCATCTDRRQR